MIATLLAWLLRPSRADDQTIAPAPESPERVDAQDDEAERTALKAVAREQSGDRTDIFIPLI